jgi:two-component system, cell cycle sensor histidine kinase and response regulator CckA
MNIERIRVQLIEDNPADAQFVRELLRKEPEIIIETADRLSRAIEYLSNGQTDVIVLDLGLPDSQGLDALTGLSNVAPHVPIVVLTGYDDETLGRRSIGMGAQDYLVKPVISGAKLARTLRFAIERKRTELALRSSEAKYRQLHESLMDGFVRVDMQGRIIDSNSTYQKMLGYSEDELRALTYMQLTPERWHEFEAKLIAEQIIPCGYSDVYEKEYRRKSGENFPVELRTSLLKDESGAPTGMWAIVRDLTERKRAEIALQTSEARLSNALKTALLGHWEYDVVNDLFTFNDCFYALMRTNAEREGGYVMTSAQYIDRFVHPDDRAMVRIEFGNNLQTINQHYGGWVEHRIVYADGEFGHISVRLFAITNDEGLLIRTNGVSQDITERKRVEEALKQSEAKHRLIANNISDVIWLYDVALDCFTYLSPSAKGLWGFEIEEALHRKMQDILTPGSYRMLMEALPGQIAALKTGDDSARTQTYELEQLRRDGTIVMTETTITLIPDEQIYVRQIQGISHDITQRKLLQREFLQAQKMEAVGRLAGGIAHDFNNLLTIIIGYSDSLLNRLPRGAPAREELELIRRAGDRAAALTSKLLAFSRKQVLQPKVIDLQILIQDSLKLLRRLIGEDIELITTLAPDLGSVEADMAQLDQVMMNLAVNSRDAMPKGGKLTLEAANVSLNGDFASDHAGARQGEYVMLAISDTGFGMDAETKAHLFEPFFTTKAMGKGTGLGLATVYGIVTQSGGFISVESELGQGATFKIYLPRVEKSDEQVTPIEMISPNGSGTILLVEDADDVRTLASRFLQEKGYAVLAANDGPSAIKMATQHAGPIHLLLTDMVMPGGMTGLDVAHMLRNSYPNVKVLVVTGYIGELAADGILPPDIAVLHKPFTANDLLHQVHEALWK